MLVLELQPNRPDCMGVVGVARELAAVQRVGLREPKVAKMITALTSLAATP